MACISLMLALFYTFLFTFQVYIGTKKENGYKYCMIFKLAGPVFMTLMSVFKDGTSNNILY